MCGFQKYGQILRVGKTRQLIAADQWRDNGRDGETVIGVVSAMAAARPTVLMIRFPHRAKLIRQALAFVAVTGHAVAPIEITPKFQFSWIVR